MKQDDCYQLGQVIKTHGLQGEVTIQLDVDFPEDYRNLESVFLDQQGKLVPFFVESIQIKDSKALVRFDDISNVTLAKGLIGCSLFLPLSNLPKLKDGAYYFHELLGCEVYENEKPLGQVKEVIDLNGNQLLAAVGKDGKEILIPIKDEILTQVNITDKLINVNLPDGLLDIYNE